MSNSAPRAFRRNDSVERLQYHLEKGRRTIHKAHALPLLTPITVNTGGIFRITTDFYQELMPP